MKNNSILMIILFVVVGGGGFFGGMKYQEMQKSTNQRSFGAGAGGRAGQGQFRGNRPIAGDIIKTDSTSITVKLQDGSSKIVLVSDKTQINKASAATRADLNVGEKVAVFGQENPDGSVTAQNVQLNPELRGMNGRSPNQTKKSDDAREIKVEGSNYKFSPATIRVKKNEKVRILFSSVEGIHDFKVDALNIATATIRSGNEDFVEFTPDKAGTYEFYCSVANHRDMGMKGSLVVE